MLTLFRNAFRSLRQRPGFTLAATLTLVLGLGANTAAFSLLDRLLLRSFSFPSLECIVAQREWDANKGGTSGRFNPAAHNSLEIKRTATQHESLTARGAATANPVVALRED